MSAEHHCKIGKITMKDKKIAALPVRPRTGKAAEMAGSVQSLVDCCDGAVGGYVFIAWNRYGYPFVSWRNDQRIMPMHILPAYIAEAIREKIATYGLEWEED